nr:septation protein IspZ [Coxiella endosymbiont of Amblyomma nuttalli]
MTTSAFQVGAHWIRFHRFEKFHVMTLTFILLLGGCTFIFYKAIFIKWKPTIVYWIFSIFLLQSYFLKNIPLSTKYLKEKLI